jgi:hypothetical protein
MSQIRLVLSAMSVLALVACGQTTPTTNNGGSLTTPNGTLLTRPTKEAAAKAIGHIYRTSTAAIAKSQAQGLIRATEEGKTVPCSKSGNVTVKSVLATAANVQQNYEIIFAACVEEVVEGDSTETFQLDGTLTHSVSSTIAAGSVKPSGADIVLSGEATVKLTGEVKYQNGEFAYSLKPDIKITLAGGCVTIEGTAMPDSEAITVNAGVCAK